MRVMAVCFCIVLIMIGIGHGIAMGVASWHVTQECANLKLADDASTPAQKSMYLGEFIQKIKNDNLPKYAAFIFTNERDSIPEQLKVLESLKTRCDDLAKVNPSELGYAQGMAQITGQEFLHATDHIRSVIEEAMWVRYGWFYTYGLFLWIGLFVLFFFVALLSPEHRRSNYGY